MLTFWIVIVILMILSFVFGVIVEGYKNNSLTTLLFAVGATLLTVLSLVVVLNQSWFM